jgi:hypothetical protein
MTNAFLTVPHTPIADRKIGIVFVIIRGLMQLRCPKGKKISDN